MKKLSWPYLLLVFNMVFLVEAKRVHHQKTKISKKEGEVTQEKVDAKNLFLLDKIVVVIYGEEDTDIITKSDVERPGIDGVYRSLQDHIIERLLYQEAKKYKMLPSVEAVEKHLQAVQAEHNLTKDELYDIFKAAGYSPEEGKEQFARMSAISSVIDFRIRSRLIVPEKDIIAYYNDHPVWEEPIYQLERAVVPIPRKKDASKFKDEIEQYLKSGIGSIKLSWGEPFWIDQADIAEEWNFITDMKTGEIKIVQKLPEGYELVKLVTKKEKRLKPLEERYREIADILRRPKYEELLTEYKSNLLDSASILYFEEE